MDRIKTAFVALVILFVISLSSLVSRSQEDDSSLLITPTSENVLTEDPDSSNTATPVVTTPSSTIATDTVSINDDQNATEQSPILILPNEIRLAITSAVRDQNTITLLIGLLIEVISVFIFGYIVARILARQQRMYEVRQNQEISEEFKLRYITNIRREIQDNLSPLMPFVVTDQALNSEQIDNYLSILGYYENIQTIFENIIGRLYERPHIKTTYWDALIPSGLLPSLVDTDTLANIADFYENLRLIVNDIEHWQNLKKKENKQYAENPRLFGLYVGLRNAREDPSSFNRKQLAPLISETIKLGSRVIADLNKIVVKITPDAEIVEVNLDTSLKLPELDKNLTISIVELDADKTYRLNKEQERYNIHLKLSSQPPEKWIESFSPSRLFTDTSGTPSYKIYGGYLILSSTYNEFVMNYPKILTAIDETNKKYYAKVEKIIKETNHEIELRYKLGNQLKIFYDEYSNESEFQNVNIMGVNIIEAGTNQSFGKYRFVLEFILNRMPPLNWGIVKRFEDYYGRETSIERGIELQFWGMDDSIDFNNSGYGDPKYETWLKLKVDKLILNVEVSFDEIKLIIDRLKEKIEENNNNYRELLQKNQEESMEESSVMPDDRDQEQSEDQVSAEFRIILDELDIKIL